VTLEMTIDLSEMDAEEAETKLNAIKKFVNDVE
jgi:hypothetical protein